MSYLKYENTELYIENVSVNDIATQYGTPCYVYSRAAIEDNWRAFENAFTNHSHLICYAVKANSNLGILNLFARNGAGFDIVSQGELERVLIAGGDPQKIIFSGVGKKSDEISRALDVDIFCFNVESESELERIQKIAAEKNKIARIALRINPNIDAKTHPYIATGLNENKFGIAIKEVLRLSRQIQTMPHLQLIGIGSHIGSQLTEVAPFLEAAVCLTEIASQFAKEGINLQTINVGGGLGITYQNEVPPSIDKYITTICDQLAQSPYKIIIEPGRAMIGNAGILLTRVEYIKPTEKKNFAIVDAGMNDLIRPSLYNAWHDIMLGTLHPGKDSKTYDIVGPVCESADFLGVERDLPLQVNDILAVCSVGAYGFSMSSNYNSRPRAAEVLVDDNKIYLLRERESLQDLFKLEKMILQ